MATFKDVANALGQELERDTVLHGVSASSAPRPHTLSFVRQWSDEAAGTVASHPDTLFLVPEDSRAQPQRAAREEPTAGLCPRRA